MSGGTDNSAGSIQLRDYLALRRSGVEQDEACAKTGMPLAEATSWDADDAKGELGWVGAPLARAPAREAAGEIVYSDGFTVSAGTLRLFVDRVERLNEEIVGLNEDKKDIFAEAKGQGFDVKTLKAVIQRRKAGADATNEADALLAVYERALGGRVA